MAEFEVKLQYLVDAESLQRLIKIALLRARTRRIAWEKDPESPRRLLGVGRYRVTEVKTRKKKCESE